MDTRIPGYLAHDELRPGQSEMIDLAYNSLSKGGYHLACAPTGIGKTAASLSSALDVAFESEEERTIFFLTGRQSQHRIVVETVRRINNRKREGEKKIRLIDMIGQQSMCIDEIRHEFSSLFSKLCADKRKNRHCSAYLQEVDGIRLKVLEEPLHVNELIDISRTHNEGGKGKPICPWKVARESASQADVVVCDYNHLFNERVRSASLDAMGINLENVIIIVDEAHNLPNRITQGMKRILNEDLLLTARLELEEHIETIEQKEKDGLIDVPPGTYSNLRRVKAALERIKNDLLGFFRVQSQGLYKDESDECRVENQKIIEIIKGALESDISGGDITLNQISSHLSKVEVELDPDLEDGKETASERLSELFSLLDEIGNNSALAFVYSHGKGDAPRITTYLLDPGIVSGPVFEQSAGALLMSGTLNPPEMYGELLALPKSRILTKEEYPSPFLSDKRPVAIGAGVTTKYNKRGEDNTNKIRSYIRGIASETPGHIAVFTPSYAMLNEIIGDEIWHGRRVMIEESGWSKQRIDSLLRDLEMSRSAGEKILLGGVFSAKLGEGIDYKRNLLDAVVCIGLPLPPPSVELNARKDYYEERFGKARSYRWAVQQPAVNSLMQAMGRPIRKMGDRAFILLLEERLLLPQFKRLLPSNMNVLTLANEETTKRHVRRFFERHPEPAAGDD
ncbi:MAG: hypothetical protein CMA77_00585 [Euryarchaeota archaeon]|nr:hypothetical protein [Euryarchaeota archaeon]